MFDITSSKLFLLAIIALLVIGPKDFPLLLRTIGKYVGIIRGHAREFRAQFDEAMRETELAQIKKDMESIARETEASLSDAGRSVEQTLDEAGKGVETALASAQETPPATVEASRDTPEAPAPEAPAPEPAAQNIEDFPAAAPDPAPAAPPARDGATPAGQPAEPATERTGA